MQGTPDPPPGERKEHQSGQNDETERFGFHADRQENQHENREEPQAAPQVRLFQNKQKSGNFVFAVFAEEWGFLGSLFLLTLYVILFLMGLEIASKTKDVMGSLLAVGVVAMLGFGVIVNIAMTSGLAPIVGIPLPLMSYGGSAMVVNLTGLGLLLNVKRRRLSLI